MQVFFGQVPTDADTTDTFDFEGNKFYYCITKTEDGVYLEDSIGRYVPIDAEALSSLIITLETMRALYEVEDIAQDAVDSIEGFFKDNYSL